MKLLNFFVLLNLFLMTTASASLQLLFNEFIGQSLELQILELEGEKLKFIQSDLNAINDWSLNLSAQDQKSFPEALFSFQSQKTNTKNYSFGLSKKFEWGGSFSFTNSLTEYDLSNWTISRPFRDGFEVKNIITYSQDLSRDFFGGKFSDELKAGELNYQVGKLKVDYDTQKKYFDFINLYLQTKLQKTILELNQLALERKTKLYQTIEKKFKDGLVQKIEKYQGQVSLESQKSKYHSVQISYQQKKSEISEFLNRDLSEVEVGVYNLEKNYFLPSIQGSTEDNLIYLQSLKNKELMELNETISQQAKRPDLKFNTSYTVNAFDEESSAAYSDANIGGDNKVVSFSLNLVIPLENTLLNNQLAKSRIERMKAEKMQADQFNKTRIKMNILSDKIKLLKENINLEKKKVDASKLALNENNRLYRLGKTEIDNILNSEEALINAELSLASMIYEYESIVLQDSLVKGKIPEIVKQYKESNE